MLTLQCRFTTHQIMSSDLWSSCEGILLSVFEILYHCVSCGRGLFLHGNTDKKDVHSRPSGYAWKQPKIHLPGTFWYHTHIRLASLLYNFLQIRYSIVLL